MKQQTKRMIKYTMTIFGLGHLLAMSVVLTLTWFTAWFGGQYAVIVTINTAGEAIYELFLVPICLVWGIWAVYYVWKHMEV